mmetsp:Transcript_16348/g.46953  ORF Transcript_16348/g.46953 Transcript_16348/m.46953 type:complete len:310 (-) Transcript_16348:421-1350(-)
MSENYPPRQRESPVDPTNLPVDNEETARLLFGDTSELGLDKEVVNAIVSTVERYDESSARRPPGPPKENDRPGRPRSLPRRPPPRSAAARRHGHPTPTPTLTKRRGFRRPAAAGRPIRSARACWRTKRRSLCSRRGRGPLYIESSTDSASTSLRSPAPKLPTSPSPGCTPCAATRPTRPRSARTASRSICTSVRPARPTSTKRIRAAFGTSSAARCTGGSTNSPPATSTRTKCGPPWSSCARTIPGASRPSGPTIFLSGRKDFLRPSCGSPGPSAATSRPSRPRSRWTRTGTRRRLKLRLRLMPRWTLR